MLSHRLWYGTTETFKFCVVTTTNHSLINFDNSSTKVVVYGIPVLYYESTNCSSVFLLLCSVSSTSLHVLRIECFPRCMSCSTRSALWPRTNGLTHKLNLNTGCLFAALQQQTPRICSLWGFLQSCCHCPCIEGKLSRSGDYLLRI